MKWVNESIALQNTLLLCACKIYQETTTYAKQ